MENIQVHSDCVSSYLTTLIVLQSKQAESTVCSNVVPTCHPLKNRSRGTQRGQDRILLSGILLDKLLRGSLWFNC